MREREWEKEREGVRDETERDEAMRHVDVLNTGF